MKSTKTALLRGAMLAVAAAMPAAQAAEREAGVPNAAAASQPLFTEGPYGSPSRTWATLLAALRAADRPAALACLDGQAAIQWKDTFTQLQDEDMRTMGNGMREFRLQLATAEIAEGLAVGKDNQAGSIGFERTPSGWKITSM